MKIKYLFRSLVIVLICLFLFSCEMTGTTTQNDKEYDSICANYYLDDELLETKNFKADETPNYDDFIVPAAIEKYKWVKDSEEIVNKVLTINYHLDYTVKTFIVTFYGSNGVILDIQEVAYGASAEEPVLDEWLAVEWDVDFSYITSFLDVHGETTYKYCKIHYYDGLHEVETDVPTYVPGEEVVLPTYEKEGYTFLGWYLSALSYDKIDKISKDEYGPINLYAKWSRYDYSNLVLPDAKYHFTKITYNESTATWQPEMPVPNGVGSYNWKTSDPNVAQVSEWSSLRGVNSGYCILTATSKSNAAETINCILKVTADGFYVASEAEVKNCEMAKVTFLGLNDEVIWEYSIRKGFNFYYPKAPIVEGYEFDHWDQDLIKLEEDTVIKAIYKEGSNEYKGKNFAIIGDSISTFYSYIPGGYAYFYPYPTANMNSFNLTWWMKTIRALGGSLYLNNSYSGSCVGAGVASDSSNSDRLNKLIIQEHTPDYILIYMGSNDCAAQFTAQKFKASYAKMLDYLVENCPNSKIILMTLPQSGLYAEIMRTQFNDVIRELGMEYSLEVLDIAEFDLHGLMVDSAHPNIEGMQKLSEELLKYFNR